MAQYASAADELCTLIATRDLVQPTIPPIAGGHTSLWRFSPPDRLAIERWFFARMDPRRWDPVWRGRYAFKDGKLCITADNETQSRCFGIERQNHRFEWRFTDGKEELWLTSQDREELSRSLEQHQK